MGGWWWVGDGGWVMVGGWVGGRIDGFDWARLDSIGLDLDLYLE